MTLLGTIQEESDSSDLRATNTRLLRELDKVKRHRDELYLAVYNAVTDNIRNLQIAPVKAPVVDRRKGDEEIAVILFSDLQLAQVTPTYNSDIAAERVERYANKIIRLTQLQRASHPVRKAKVYFLGDLIENELTFPSQPHQIDASLYNQVALTGPKILTDFIRRLLTTFESIDVVSVPGNHGEPGGPSRKMANPETNFDRMLSTILRHIFEAAHEKRISWRIPDGYGRSSFYAVDYVGDTGFMLFHGHQARRTSSSSHLPFFKLMQGWRAGAIPEHFKIGACGHHHTPTYLTINDASLYINGTFASDSEYAIERLASNSKCSQWLLFAKPGRGVTAQYLVDLQDD
jgi:hypothetical protein